MLESSIQSNNFGCGYYLLVVFDYTVDPDDSTLCHIGKLKAIQLIPYSGHKVELELVPLV